MMLGRARTGKTSAGVERLAAAGVVLAAMMGVVPATGLSRGIPAASQASLPLPVGGTPVIPSGAHAVGAAPASAPVRFDVVLRPRNPAGLEAFATAVSTPGSPSYHHFLSVAQVAARFAPSLAVIRQVDGALRGIGLPPGPVSANHLVIPVTTTMGHASAALQTRFTNYRLPSGRISFANTRTPKLPAVVARHAQAVIGLNNLAQIAPMAGSRTASHVWRAKPGGLESRATASGSVACQAAVKAAQADNGWTYSQLAKAYSLTGLYQGGSLGGGVKVALFELEPWLSSDVTKFQGCYGSSGPVSRINVDGGPGTGPGSAEAVLDIETVSALAPKASLLVYDAPSSNAALSTIDEYTQILDQDRAQVLSSSWGGCESDMQSLDAGLIQSENTLFEQAASEGISVFVAAGDSGSEACNQTDASMKQLSVQDPASQPYVTSVGGTELTALGPPPTEKVWNDPSTPPTGAGGGGISSQWPMPSWQAGPGVINRYSSKAPCQATSGYCREVPDVSASADYQAHGYIFVWNSKWVMNGGTSAAAPLWAGILADIDSQGSPATREGFLNPRLYSLPSGTLNDIRTGGNDYTGTHQGKYPATAGYDMASGLGSPIAAKLSQALRRWVAIEAPLPADQRPETNFAQPLSFVTCPSSCEAVGGYTGGQGNGSPAVVLSGSGMSWIPAELSDTHLDGEACPAPRTCVVVGEGGHGPLFTGWGSSWQSQRLPSPPNAAPNALFLNSVTCGASSQCVAAGNYLDTSGATQGLIVTGSGNSWTSTEAPLPPNAASSPQVNLTAAACPSPSSCIVTGVYTDSAGHQQGVLLTGSGTSWVATKIILPAHAGAAANPQVSPISVTCQSAVSCIVTVVYTGPSGPGDFRAFLLAGAGTAWTAIKPPLPANASTSSVVWLTNAACPSTTSCTVAGFYTSASGIQEGLVLNGKGTSWKATQTPWPAAGSYMQYLGPITCSSPTACLIVGQYTDSSDLPQGLVLTGSGSSWKATKAPLPANASKSTARWVQLNSAACHSAVACVAVGQYTDKTGYLEPLILSGAIK